MSPGVDRALKALFAAGGSATDEMMAAALEAAHEGAWLIWSNEHGAWWRSNSCGYTTTIEQAGRYSKRQADAICAGANIVVPPHRQNEVAIRAPEA